MSSNCVSLLNKMYFKVQYYSRSFVDQDEQKGIVILMTISLKQSIPFVVKLFPEVLIRGEW